MAPNDLPESSPHDAASTAFEAAHTPQTLEEPALVAPIATPVAAAPAAPRGWWATPWLWLLGIIVLGIIAPFVPAHDEVVYTLGVAASTLIYVGFVIAFVVGATRLAIGLKERILFFGIALAWWIGLQFGAWPHFVEPFFQTLRAQGAAPTFAQNLILALLSTLMDASLLVAAVMGGSLIARIVKTPNMIGPICAIVALIDIWGVLFGGIVSQLIEKAPSVAGKAMTSLPSVGSAGAIPTQGFAASIQPAQIGVGDYLFLGLLFGALHLNGMNWRGAARLVMPLVALALLAVASGDNLLKGGIMLPGLLFIGAGVAIPNRRYFQYTREEKFALLYAFGFVTLLTIGLFFAITSQLPPAPPRPA